MIPWPPNDFCHLSMTSCLAAHQLSNLINSERVAILTFTFDSLAWTSDASAATKFRKDSIPTGAFTKPKGIVP